MANEEHLDILSRGVAVWNKWRKDNPKLIPELHFADLRKVDLNGIDFIQANLYQTYLTNTNLSGANLSGARLLGADLRGANLSGADLSGAYLPHAYLNEVNLCGTILSTADFSGAYLPHADLSDALLRFVRFNAADLSSSNFYNTKIERTVFANADLKNVKNLMTCKHLGPSYIDHSTLINSGKLPEKFLRGCGFPDEFIEYIPSLFWEKSPFEFYSCFISYSSKDEAFAKRLHADLQDNGVRCWFTPEDMKIGDKIRDRIDESIRVYDKLLLIFSENSLNSTWVENEVESAFEKEEKSKGTVLFPIRLDAAVMDTGAAWAKTIKRTRHIGDFTCWKAHDAYQEAFQRLLRDLKGGDE